jgi:hypothetical protein
VVEVADKRPLFDALGFNPAHAFVPRPGSAGVPPAASGVAPEASSDLKGLRRDAAYVFSAVKKGWRPNFIPVMVGS